MTTNIQEAIASLTNAKEILPLQFQSVHMQIDYALRQLKDAPKDNAPEHIHNPTFPCSCSVEFKGKAYSIQYCPTHALTTLRKL